MVGGGMSCIKYILAVFNFVFVIFGILLIVFGSQSISETRDFKALLEDPDKIAIGCIVVGVILFIIAFLGCCGALRENQCMLMSFSVILVILLIVELIIGGVGFAFKDQLRSIAEDGFNSTMYNYDRNDPSKPETQALDKIQEKMECCGMYNYTDWKRVNPDEPFFPQSCCPLKPDDETIRENVESCSENSPNLNKDGCLDKMVDVVLKVYGPVGLIVITVAILQLLGIMFACCLTYAVKKEYQVV